MGYKHYTKDEIKWFQDWEKNFESTLKDLKKFREYLDNKPKLTTITATKYGLYFRLMEQEILELMHMYDELEPVLTNEKSAGT